VKLAPAQVAGFLKHPPADIVAILIYGTDEGLVRERADLISAAILGGTTDDPFRLSLLTADKIRQDPARLADEATAQSLIGGRRVVRIREADDALTKPLAYVLDSMRPSALLILEGSDLATRSTLRKLMEDGSHVATIACYADGPRELTALIRDTMATHKIRIADEAVEYLVQNLGGNRLATRQELEKLTLQAGDGGVLTLDDVAASVGDSSILAVEDVIYDALDGKAASVEAALTRLFLEAESPVAIVRAAQRHVQKLHLSAARIAAGESIDNVVRSLRPPIFYKFEPRFRAQLGAWKLGRLQQLLSRLTQAELDCKSTGYPDETICRRVLSGIGRANRG